MNSSANEFETITRTKKSAKQRILLSVFDDPNGLWSGQVKAELTKTGLNLKGAEGWQSSVPLGSSETEWPTSSYVRILCEGRSVTFVVEQPGVDQVRLARDLAEWVRGKKPKLHLADYQLPIWLRFLALTPMFMGTIFGLIFLAGEQRFADVPKQLGAFGSCALASVVLLFWSFAGYPSVRIRCVGMLILAFICNMTSVLTWVVESGAIHEVLGRVPGK
jgi:hypothetical protein